MHPLHPLSISESASANYHTQDLLIYCENIEKEFRFEYGNMTKKIDDLTLDLEDATRTRRELQRQVDTYNQRLVSFTADNQNLKVTCADWQI